MIKSEEDVYNYQYSLTNAEKLLDVSSVISNQDKELIWNFVQHLRANGVSTGRLAKYVFYLKKAIEHLGVQTTETRRQNIEGLVIWLQRDSGYTAHTISDYIFAVKRFFKFVRYGNIDKETPYPEEVRWLKTAIKPSERK